MGTHTEPFRWGGSKISTERRKRNKTSEVPSVYTLRRGIHLLVADGELKGLCTRYHTVRQRTPCVPSIYCVQPRSGVFTYLHISCCPQEVLVTPRVAKQGCSGERSWWRHLVTSQARRQRCDSPCDRGTGREKNEGVTNVSFWDMQAWIKVRV